MTLGEKASALSKEPTLNGKRLAIQSISVTAVSIIVITALPAVAAMLALVLPRQAIILHLMLIFEALMQIAMFPA